MQNISDSNFNEIINAGAPVVIDFWAPWCGPCRMISPLVDELAEEYAGRVNVCKCNVDECLDVPANLGVRNIPTIIFFKDGQMVDRMVGANPKSAIEEKIKNLL